MRWYLLSLASVVGVFSCGYFYLSWQSRALQEYCNGLPLGWTISQVRDSAHKEGFIVEMEPFFQMRVGVWFWHPQDPSCRVVFDGNKTVAFRSWQIH